MPLPPLLSASGLTRTCLDSFLAATPRAVQTLTRSLDEVSAAKESQARELSAALVFLKEKKEANEARLAGELRHCLAFSLMEQR